jgi:uncharacterized BrkB/YihY/UPF0761 family membrane protein
LSTEDAGGGSTPDEAGEGETSSFLVRKSAFDSFLLLLAAAPLLFLLLSLLSVMGAKSFNRLDDSLRTTSNFGLPEPLERPLAREVEATAGMVTSDALK